MPVGKPQLLLVSLVILLAVPRLWRLTCCLSDMVWPPLDPGDLSVVQLQAILDWRAIHHEHVLEKSELVQLVTQSGPVNKKETEAIAMLKTTEPVSDIVIRPGKDYYQQKREGTSYRLIMVNAAQKNITASKTNWNWKNVRDWIRRYGVETGVLDCNLDPEWCEKKGWTSTRLLFTIPLLDYHENTVHEYTAKIQKRSIHKWIRKIFKDRFSRLYGMTDIKGTLMKFNIKNRYATYDFSGPDVRAVLVTRQHLIPLQLLLEVYSVPGITLRYLIVRESYNSFLDWFREQGLDTNMSEPFVLFVTRESAYEYGKLPEERLDRNCILMFLSFWYPSPLHILHVCSVITVVISIFKAFAQGSVSEQLSMFFFYICQYGERVFLLWFFWMGEKEDILPFVLIKPIRLLITSSLLTEVRRDALFYHHHSYIFVLVSFCAVFSVAYDLLTNNDGDQRGEAEGGRISDDERQRLERITIERRESQRQAEYEQWERRRREAQRTELLAALMTAWENGQIVMNNAVPLQRADQNSPPLAHPPSYIDQLPTRFFDSSVDTSGICAICLEEYEHSATLSRLPCGHEFHKNCITRWLGSKRECPICRAHFFRP